MRVRVGPLWVFCAGMPAGVPPFWGLPLWTGLIAALANGALCGAVSGTLVAKAKIPPFIATLGMMLLLKGLSLVISHDKLIYFNDTPGFTSISQDSLLGEFFPSLPIPNAPMIL